MICKNMCLAAVTSDSQNVRELSIVFVYDPERCQQEEDDPQEAVMYFHPSWVNDQQRLALCGQLMGATQFFLTSFSCPRILSLDSGKFVLQQSGHYIVAVGTDHNIPDWVLEHRAATLHDLVRFYHQDLETIAVTAGSSETSFRDKLCHIFETFLPILQYAANLFGTIPSIRLPKLANALVVLSSTAENEEIDVRISSASNVFLEAIQILQCCQDSKGVLGGTLLYGNRVVATQLSSTLTKKLVSSDPHHIKSPAESISTPFHTPVGVQLLTVYLDEKEFSKLSQDALKARLAIESIASKRFTHKKVLPGKFAQTPKEVLSSMKRDTSRIFTVVEEKEGESEHPDEEPPHVSENHTEASADRGDKHLTSSDVETNLGKVLHAKVVSICCGADEAGSENAKKPNTLTTDFINVGMKKKKAEHLDKSGKNKSLLINRENDIRSLSLNDLQPSSKLTTNRVPMKYYSLGLPKLQQAMCSEDYDQSPVNKLPPGKHFYNTITDPLFPIFRCDGLPVSHALFDEYLERHYKLLDMETTPETSSSDVTFIGDAISIKKNNPKLEDDHSNTAPESQNKCTGNTKTITSSDTASEKPVISAVKSQEVYRRSLSLPLKNMTSECNVVEEGRKRCYTVGELESPLTRNGPLGSLQLTPLMSKLSILSREEQTGGFRSRDTTPSERRRSSFPAVVDDYRHERRERKVRVAKKKEGSSKIEDFSPKKVVLYVFGQQDMTLLLLLEESSAQEPELIHNLWEVSVNSLTKLEVHLHQCLDHFPQGEGPEPYSFLCLDPCWDMLQRGGTWDNTELQVVSCLHNDFQHNAGLTEIVVRCEDSTVYGYQCGQSQVFYQQTAGSNVGLPTPSDMMGLVPLKARRRLERDHGIVLL
uniref:CCZ1/INTU/HSP4 first Longin domain-containing protein n=1 Tax=Timema shepardi TaxID=629360 RepID=A0A7R9B4M8_TIMSH|nr:unnamed protein product [Timema shepardi]